MVEFCDNPKTTAHVKAWRGKKDLTAASLLIKLWRKEEKELGVKRDKYGKIIGKYIQFCFGFWVTLSYAQVLLLALHSKLLMAVLKEPCGVPGIKPGKATCKASALPTTVLSLHPSIYFVVNC